MRVNLSPPLQPRGLGHIALLPPPPPLYMGLVVYIYIVKLKVTQNNNTLQSSEQFTVYAL
jgi:hypothetical protein